MMNMMIGAAHRQTVNTMPNTISNGLCFIDGLLVVPVDDGCDFGFRDLRDESGGLVQGDAVLMPFEDHAFEVLLQWFPPLYGFPLVCDGKSQSRSLHPAV